ncbi:MAG TPA: hypothetical protein VK399_19615 [Longimicrobiaceae bacterium]|jgi:hypothetical protein|nr:hypothetical protein [Longimicrobiaceae bacterium]
MRDIDREIGIGGGFRRGAAADDAGAVERNRRIGEMLLLADEMEETVDVLRSDRRPDPLQPGRSREDTLRALELRSQAERRRLEALERQGVIDYDAVARAMPVRDEMS